MLNRFQIIHNEFRYFGKHYDNYNHNNKILCSLPIYGDHKSQLFRRPMFE